MIFDREWIENELIGLESQLTKLIVQLHQTEGAIQVLQQMLQHTNGAEQSAPLLNDILPEGVTIESIDPIPPPALAGAMAFDVVIPDEEQEPDNED